MSIQVFSTKATVIMSAALFAACYPGALDFDPDDNNPNVPQALEAGMDGGDADVDGGDGGSCPQDCTGSSPYCNTTLNECVACLDNTHCPSAPAPHCDTSTGTCTGCIEDAECAVFTGTPVCDEASKMCVQCTEDSEEAQCGDFSCRLNNHTCTTTLRHSRDTCDACEADSECIEMRKCVLLQFTEGATTDVGTYCFFDQAQGGCGDTVVERRPYRTVTETMSIDGDPGFYCLPPTSTTCKGIRDTQSVSCTMDSECGELALNDGYCPSAGTGAGACSYLCNGSFECGGTLECGGSPQHCRPAP